MHCLASGEIPLAYRGIGTGAEKPCTVRRVGHTVYGSLVTGEQLRKRVTERHGNIAGRSHERCAVWREGHIGDGARGGKVLQQ